MSVLRRAILFLVGAPAVIAPSIASAQSTNVPLDSAVFVTRLGADTLVIERVVRSPRRVQAEVAMRVPRTSRTMYVLELSSSGLLERMEATTFDTTGGGAAPTRREIVTRVGDSLRIETTLDAQARSRAVRADPTALPFIDMVHWPYEIALMRFRSSGIAEGPQPLLTGGRVSNFALARAIASAERVASATASVVCRCVAAKPHAPSTSTRTPTPEDSLLTTFSTRSSRVMTDCRRERPTRTSQYSAPPRRAVASAASARCRRSTLSAGSNRASAAMLRPCGSSRPAKPSPVAVRNSRRCTSGHTASESEVKVKSRSFIGGIIITNGDSSSPTRTGLPNSSMLLSMITGDSLKRKFFTGCLISPFSM